MSHYEPGIPQKECPSTETTARISRLKSWSSLTTRLLQQGGHAAWNVLDEPFGPNFGTHLQDELEKTGYWKKIRTSRTTSEALTDDVMKILSQNRVSAETLQTLSNPLAALSAMAGGTAHSQQNTMTTTTTTTPPPHRGDLSVFLPRSLRARKDFGRMYPFLDCFIQTIERTVSAELKKIDFDFSLTSMQLAEYPGDGKAGYPRHCDREGKACQSSSSTSFTSSSKERILTVLYYLTDNDWDAHLDGGAIRIFGKHHGEYTDVVPYPNRMIIFRSDAVEHEVRPSYRRPRRAITMWLYGKAHMDEESEGIRVEPSVSGTRASTIPTLDHNRGAGPPPLSIVEPVDEIQPSIFVSIVAFRDSETVPTLCDLMDKAVFPERVHVGLVLQVDGQSDGETIVSELYHIQQDPWFRNRVRMVQMDARFATGPCPARAMAQLLFRGEDYVLQIDSHMRFRPNWDAYLIHELRSCPRELSLLTTYPVGYQLPNQIPNETRGTVLYPWKFDDNAMLRQKARFVENALDSPITCQLFAAGFCFGPSSWIKNCPYDGNLHHLFFGEEISMALRLYTAGYDLCAPRETVCYHLWSRSHRPPSNPISDHLRKASLDVVRSQMQGRGLGSERSIDEWAAHVGVDLSRREVIHCPTNHQDLAKIEP